MEDETIREIQKNTKNTTKKVIVTIIISIIIVFAVFTTYEISTVNNTYYINEKNLQIPIFVYHDIVATEDEVEYEYMQTTVENFKNQIVGLMNLRL